MPESPIRQRANGTLLRPSARFVTRLKHTPPLSAAGESQGEERMDNMSDNVWDFKPWWCKPYSILTTGSVGVVGAWAISGNSVIITIATALLVGTWWYVFLIAYPSEFRAYVQRLKSERTGFARREDTWTDT